MANSTTPRSIALVDKDMHAKRIFKSAREAIAQTGCSYMYIYNRCTYAVHGHKEFDQDGLTFRYADDDSISMRDVPTKDYIGDHISDRMLMILIMEEASELIQACAKRLRVADPEGYTPVSPGRACTMFAEEANDLLMLLELAGIVDDGTTAENPKWLRWYNRIKEAHRYDDEMESNDQ